MRSSLRWRARVVALASLACALTLPGGVGNAATRTVAAEEASDAAIPLSGPVAIIAIGLGVLGLVIGLVRKRKQVTESARVAAQKTAQVPAQSEQRTDRIPMPRPEPDMRVPSRNRS